MTDGLMDAARLAERLVDYLLVQSLYAAVVAGLVWTVLAVVRPRHPLLHLALWWLVLARLVLPTDFATSWSIRSSAETMMAHALWPDGTPHINPVGPAHAATPVLAAPATTSGLTAGTATVHPPSAASVPSVPASVVPSAAPIAETATPFWPLALTLLWAGGVAAMAILLARAVREARRLVLLAEPAGRTLAGSLVEAWRHRLAVRRPVRLLVTPEVSAPFTTGLWRPVIVLPRRLVARLDAAELSAVIGHEMAHVRGFDVAWRGVERLLLILFFFHPLVWMAVRRIDVARESCCDQRAATAGMISTLDYGRGLIAALKAFRLPATPTLAGTLGVDGATGHGLKQRLVWLKQGSALSTPARVAGLAGVATLGLLVLPLAHAAVDPVRVATTSATDRVAPVPALPSHTLVKQRIVAAAPQEPAAPAAPAVPQGPGARVPPGDVVAAPPVLPVPPAPPVPPVAVDPGAGMAWAGTSFAQLQREANARLGEAQRQLEQAEAAHRKAHLGIAGSKLSEAEKARTLRESQRALEEARRDLAEARADARRDLEDARRDLEDARREALEAQREARREAAEARREALREAEQARRDALLERSEALREASQSLRDAARSLKGGQGATGADVRAAIKAADLGLPAGAPALAHVDWDVLARSMEAAADHLERQAAGIR